MERGKKALKNVSVGVASKMILYLLSFATRTIFIKLLGIEYTGISSLYSNILSVLSLAELGIGNVLMFYLYSALKKKDEEQIRNLVGEFKKIYKLIVICILTIGIAIVPFLKYIINSELSEKQLIIYYLLYLLNSVASYFVIYRTMVLSADQKSYISNICSTVSIILMYILQLVYLLIFKNFLGYLIIQVICTFSNNIILNYIVCKKYPYLKKKIKNKTNTINRRNILENVKATFLYKIAETILDQTDSIIISIMFGTIYVGLYSNYYMIIVALVSIASIIANNLVSSFGNLNAENDMEKSYAMFKVAMLFFSMWGTLCTALYACVIQDFIKLWVGQEYLMEFRVIIAILAVFYLRMATNAMWMYRSSMGLFKEVQYVNLIAAVFNIIFSIIFGKIFGICGVIMATAISRLITSFWFEGKVLFNKFKKKASIYYIQQAKDFAIAIIVFMLSFVLSNIVPFHGIVGILLKSLICMITTVLIEWLTNYKNEEFKILKSKLVSSIKR